MMFRARPATKEEKLLTLVRLLETRGPTAREAAKVIGDAIANKGKLDLGKGPGRSSAKKDQM